MNVKMVAVSTALYLSMILSAVGANVQTTEQEALARDCPLLTYESIKALAHFDLPDIEIPLYSGEGRRLRMLLQERGFNTDDAEIRIRVVHFSSDTTEYTDQNVTVAFTIHQNKNDKTVLCSAAVYSEDKPLQCLNKKEEIEQLFKTAVGTALYVILWDAL